MTLTLVVDLPDDLARFRLPEAVDARLQSLLDRQDSGQLLIQGKRIKINHHEGSKREYFSDGLFSGISDMRIMPLPSETQPQVVIPNDSVSAETGIASDEAPKGRRNSGYFHHLSHSLLGEASFNAFALRT